MGREPEPARHSSDESVGVIPPAARPATVFLSYKREDVEEVRLLQSYLIARGIHAWRDETDLGLGVPSRAEIARFIEEEADAFLLYLTPDVFNSRFIWDDEVRPALRRWERDRSFKIIPVFRGVSVAELQIFCSQNNYGNVYEFSGVFLPGGSGASVEAALRQVAQRTLRAALEQRFRRVKAGLDYEPRLALHTYDDASGPFDLDLNWAGFFSDGKSPDHQEWQTILLPALRSVKDALSEMKPNRPLHLMVQAHLSAALALGAAFPAVSGFTLWVEGQQGTWKSEALAAVPNIPPLLRKQYKAGTGAGVVVEIAVAQDTTQGVSNTLQHLGLDYRYRVRLGNRGYIVGSAAEATAIAAQVRAELKKLRTRLPVPEFHLFLSTPASLAVLIGTQLNALGTIKVYEYHKPTNGYILAYTLDGA